MNEKIKTLTLSGVLTALMVIMSYTPIGYLKIGAVDITLMCIPVIAGIFLSDLKGGLVLGTVFGVTSFLQCFGFSAFGSTIFGISPVRAFIVCIVPRVLMGVLASLLYSLVKKAGVNKIISYGILSVSAPVLNTVLFVTLLMLLYGNSEYITGLRESVGKESLFGFLIAVFGLNAASEAGLCLVVGTPLCKALEKIKIKGH